MTRARLKALMDADSFSSPGDREKAVELALLAAEAERGRIARRIEVQPWVNALPFSRAVMEDLWDA